MRTSSAEKLQRRLLRQAVSRGVGIAVAWACPPWTSAMENSLKNIFAVSDLRNWQLFTLGMLGVYRIGHHIPTPGVNAAARRTLRSRCRTRCSACTTCSRAGTCRG